MVAVEVISSPTSRAWRVPCSVAMMVALVSSRTPATMTLIDSVERSERSASLRTSAATTAKPLPASPARAASMAALRASRLVWPAMSSISSRISPIFWARSPSDRARTAIASTFSCISRMVTPVRSAASAMVCTVSAMAPAVVASSSIVADVSATAADCSLVTVAASFAASRSSPATSPRTDEVDLSRVRKPLSRFSVAAASASRRAP